MRFSYVFSPVTFSWPRSDLVPPWVRTGLHLSYYSRWVVQVEGPEQEQCPLQYLMAGWSCSALHPSPSSLNFTSFWFSSNFFDSLNEDDAVENNQLVFDVAEREFASPSDHRQERDGIGPGARQAQYGCVPLQALRALPGHPSEACG